MSSQKSRRSYAPLSRIALGAALSLHCGGETEAREQLLVIVDTDALLLGDVSRRSDLSADAAIDMLRVDILTKDNQIADSRIFSLADPSNWPLSFGILPIPGESVARARLRAFRADFASEGKLSGQSQTTLDPPREVSIDRLAAFDFTSDFSTQRVLLAADCLGVPASFSEPLRTCVDAERLGADPSEGVEVLRDRRAALESKNGTWVHAREIPCGAPTEPDRVCVPGGFTILGDLDGVGAGSERAAEPVPLRPALLKPFVMDRYEFTVGRLRRLVRNQSFDAPLPHLREIDPEGPDNFNRYCTWLGPNDANNDALPVNCVTYETAALACQLEGGALPTEAQWEFAGRGRGERRSFPWGNSAPSCCTSSLSRQGPRGIPVKCSGTGVEPVGSHETPADCGDIGDVSRDGVVDLGGSVAEALRDRFAAYDARCWSTSNILVDPLCSDADTAAHSARGGYWNSGTGRAYVALRNSYTSSPAAGFRCVYEVTP